MKTLSLGMMTALFIGSTMAQAALAQAKALPPNRVICKGDDLALSYNATSFRGDPQLFYSHGLESDSFEGAQIRSESSVLGHLVTVVLRTIPDLGSDTVTLILPPMNLREIGDQLTFETQVVESRHNTSIGGPSLVNGLLIESAFIPVTCEASIVAF